VTLYANVAPSANFDLSNWKITLPVDSSGGFGGTAVEVKNLDGYQHSKYFVTANDGAMVFNAPVNGATTSGSSYARSELREMNGADRAAWNLSTGGFMAATLEVDQVPTKTDGTQGRVIVGQIHGQDEELVRLYWDKGTVYFQNDQAGSNNSETKFSLLNSAGQSPNISLNEKFSYTINAKGESLVVKVLADGQTYTSSTRINDVWDTDSFYFKAGMYLGVNESTGTGSGQSSFYALNFNHSGTVREPAPTGTVSTDTTNSTNTTTPTNTTNSTNTTTSTGTSTTALPVTTKTISGSEDDNDVVGTSGNDLLKGNGGDDEIWGKGGLDVLSGGAGKDNFTFDTKLSSSNVDVITDYVVADDTIFLDSETFTSLKWGDLSSSAFVVGDKALDAGDRIIYSDKTGALSYDADGSGAVAAVQFAKIANLAKLTAADFDIC
jgi:hypothetical protein